MNLLWIDQTKIKVNHLYQGKEKKDFLIKGFLEGHKALNF